MTIRITAALGSVLWLTCAGSVKSLAQNPTPPKAATPSDGNSPAPNVGGQAAQQAPVPATVARIQQLIEQLGSDRFSERELASAELLQAGEAALLPLAAAEQSRDSEIRSRSLAIRNRIERTKFEGIANSFKKDNDPTASYGLPGWKSFSKVAGTARPTKRLFLDFIEQRRVIALCLESIDGGSVPDGVFEGLPNDPKERLKYVIAQTCAEIRTNLLIIGNRPEAGDLIAMLVAVQLLDDPMLDIHEVIRLQCNMGALDLIFNNPGAGASGRKLLGGWFLRAPTSYAFEVFSIGRAQQIPETADMARRALSTQTDVETATAALLMLSVFGNANDLAIVDKYVDDQTLLREFAQPVGNDIDVDNVAPPNLKPDLNPRQLRVPDMKTYRRTLGDVAVAVGMKLAGMDVYAYFPGIKIDEIFGVREATIGFPSEKPEMRTAALKAYREHRAKQNPSAS